MQANVEGGLSEQTIARIRELADGADLRVTAPATRQLSADATKLSKTDATGPNSNSLPLPGTLITRVYKGRELRVRVTTKGFEFEGELFRSLSGRRQTRHRLALEREQVLQSQQARNEQESTT